MDCFASLAMTVTFSLVITREGACEENAVLILMSLRSKRLEGWTRMDSRPSFETRARARPSSDNGEAVAQG
jgi:hypothetical protein